jgi:hypothetical protein
VLRPKQQRTIHFPNRPKGFGALCMALRVGNLVGRWAQHAAPPGVCTFFARVSALVSQPNGTKPRPSERSRRLQAAYPDSRRGLRPVVLRPVGSASKGLLRPLKRPFPKSVQRAKPGDAGSPLKRAEGKEDERRVPAVNDRPKTRLRRASPVNGASGCRKAIRRSLNVETPLGAARCAPTHERSLPLPVGAGLIYASPSRELNLDKPAACRARARGAAALAGRIHTSGLLVNTSAFLPDNYANFNYQNQLRVREAWAKRKEEENSDDL